MIINGHKSRLDCGSYFLRLKLVEHTFNICAFLGKMRQRRRGINELGEELGLVFGARSL